MDYYDYLKHSVKSSEYLFEYLKNKYYSGMEHLGLYYKLDDKYSTEEHKYICFMICNKRKRIIMSVHFKESGLDRLYHYGYAPPYSNSEIERGIKGHLSYIYRKETMVTIYKEGQ